MKNKFKNSLSPSFRMSPQNTVGGVVDTLDKLYRNFQDEYKQRKELGNEHGKVSVVSNTHFLPLNNRERVVTLPEIYVSDNQDVQEFRSFNNLLPHDATFYIIHYPQAHDVFVVEW